MPSIQFQAEVWEQGNSILITIPKQVKQMYSISKGDVLDVYANIINKRLLEEIKELNTLRARYSNEAQGFIFHKGEKIAILDKVFFTELTFRGGALAPGQSFDTLPIIKSTVGVIYKGRFLPTIFEDTHYTRHGIDKAIERFLTGTETMKLTLSNGQKIELKNIDFEEGLSTEKGLAIKKVEFRSRQDRE